MNTDPTDNQTKGIVHGECLIFQSKIPEDAIPEQHSDKQIIIANSEVTGNHHVIMNNPGVKFYHNSAKTRRFMKNETETSVQCVIADRHTAIPIPPGEWEIDMQQEFDYFAMAKRNVAD